MAAYDIQKHFSGLRVQTARRRGRSDPFATGFEDDSDEDNGRKSRVKTKAPPVVKSSPLPPRAPSASKSVSSPFAAIDAFRDSDDDFLDVPTQNRTDRRPSPAPAKLAAQRDRVTADGTGRRGSLPGVLSDQKKAAVLAAGPLAYLDDSDDDLDSTYTQPGTRTGRGHSPAPKHRSSDPTEGLTRSSPPRGDRLLKPDVAARLNPVNVPLHTVASPFAGTKYLQDSDSDEEAVASRKGSTEEADVADLNKKHHEVTRVDKPSKQNGSGVSWRAFSVGRAEQRNAELEALQSKLRARGKCISFNATAVTDDGRRIPISTSAERVGGIIARKMGQSRSKSPPRRAEDTKPAEDELVDRQSTFGGPIGIYDPTQFKTNPFTGEPVLRTVNEDREADSKRPGSAGSIPDIRIDDISQHNS